MIQFNLLPDVKLQYIKTKYRKRLVMGISIIVSAFFLAIFLFLFLLVRVQQKQEISSINNDIATESKTLKEIPDLDKILTIQNQLNSLPGLHGKKVISSRLFDYLSQLTPVQATISNADIDFEANTLTIKGTADELSVINKFVDTLKFTTYKTLPAKEDEEPKEGKAFTGVVLSTFSVANNSITTGEDANKANYQLTLSFDPIIFASLKIESTSDPNNLAQPVSLIVPKIITTRSELEKPNTLFAPQPVPDNSEDR